MVGGVVGGVTGVVEDDEGAWFCEMHPNKRFATCDAPVKYSEVGPRRQVASIPDYVGPPESVSSSSSRGGARASFVCVGGDEEGSRLEDEEMAAMDAGADAASASDVARHARLRPMSVDDLCASVPSRPRRTRGLKGKGKGAGTRGKLAAAHFADNLPACDSQRPENVAAAEEAAAMGERSEEEEDEVEEDEEGDDDDLAFGEAARLWSRAARPGGQPPPKRRRSSSTPSPSSSSSSSRSR